MKKLLFIALSLSTALLLNNCKKEQSNSSTTSTTSSTSTTSTTASTSTTGGIANNTIVYNNTTIDSLNGSCDFGSDLGINVLGNEGIYSYTVDGTFQGGSPKTGIYKTAELGVLASEGICIILLKREFLGSIQELYPTVGTEVELKIVNGKFRMSMPKTRFISVTGGSFTAELGFSNIGCD